MQLLFESSEEGKENGLGLLKCRVKKINKGKMHVPNIGWRRIEKSSNVKDQNLLPNSDFYFMHSYAVLTKQFLKNYNYN